MLLPTPQHAHVRTGLHRDAEDKVWVGEEVGTSVTSTCFKNKTSRQKHQVEFLDVFFKHGFALQPLYATRM